MPHKTWSVVKQHIVAKPQIWALWLLYVLFLIAFLNFEKWGWQGTPLDRLLGAIETLQAYTHFPILFLLLFAPYFFLSRFWHKQSWKFFGLLLACCVAYFFVAHLTSPCSRNAFEGRYVVFMCERYRGFTTNVVLALALSPVLLMRGKVQAALLVLSSVAALAAAAFLDRHY